MGRFRGQHLFPMVLVGGLLVAAAAAAQFGSVGRVEVRDRAWVAESATPMLPTEDPLLPPAPVPFSSLPFSSLSLGVLSLIGMLIGLLLVLVAIGYLLWLIPRFRRGSGRRVRVRPAQTRAAASSPGEPDREEQMLAAVATAQQQLRDGDRDPRGAVIACWVRLTEAAAEVGIGRHGADTATDLVLRLLRSRQVSEPVLTDLLAAYWLARYATHPVDEQMRAAAVSALSRLEGELRAVPAASPMAGPEVAR